jgi:aspartate kinase
VHVDARQIIITDSQFQKAVPQDALIEKRSAEKLLPLLAEGHVPVMGGFIASNEAGITTTLGRGGSDFTAALIGGALQAEAIEIWTDVDGIMTADPRVCPDALRVKVISFEEAAELAYFGAKVLHPATILPAVKKNIPVLVLNSRNAACEGTRIISLPPHCKSPFKSIAVKKKLSIIDVVAGRMLMTHGYMKEIFTVFDNHKCPVDMVSTSEVSVSLTVDSNEKLPAIAADLGKLADVKYEGKKALDLPGGRRHPRPQRHGRPGLHRHPPHQRAHDLPGRQRNQYEFHDRRRRRRRSRALAARRLLPGPRPGDLRR